MVILGEMRELGDYSKIEHKKIIEWCIAQNIPAILIGKEFYQHKEPTLQYFETLEKAQDFITENPIKNHFILIKGSHGVHLERLRI